MKAHHRIRRHLLMLLLLMLHCASAADFSKCGTDNKIQCLAHGKSCTTIDADAYIIMYPGMISNDCKRYFIIETISIEKVQIEFRDNTFDKVAGAGFYKGVKETFACKDNKASASLTDVEYTAEDIYDNSAPSNDLYCKFTLTAKNKPANIGKALQNFATQVTSLSDRTKTINGLNIGNLKYPFCDWSVPFLNRNDADDDENKIPLTPANNDADRQCKADYFNWYKDSDAAEWVQINRNFHCDAGTITTVKTADGSNLAINFDTGKTKCTKKKCAECACPFCNKDNLASPNFTATDGKSCAKMACPKKMIVYTSPTAFHVHPNTTIDCTVDEKWKVGEQLFDSFFNITCIDEARCSELHPIKTDCSTATAEEGKNCTEASLTNSGAHVCDGKETRLLQPGKGQTANVATSFTCDTTTGNWKAILEAGEDAGPVVDDTNVYCMEDIKEEIAQSDGKTSKGNAIGGTLIGIIVGVAFVVVIIVIVVVLCLRRHFKKKGNRDEMKSVSVTGRGDKKSKKKKNWKLSSGSKTSEQISAPPPPPCPDSLNLPNEPEPTPQSQQPSSGGGTPAAVGPDTGKPDKPAELIDIKLDSEKRETEKESKKAKDDPSVVNTVTGTTFDKSKVDAPTGTISTKKTNNESARSDTGTGSKVDGKSKKKKLKVKDGKVELDKNGRGMTDDDDYNIDEGAKPVDAVDKNKKPYSPAVDPRKKMINVTVTEDEDGKIQPKNKPQPF